MAVGVGFDVVDVAAVFVVVEFLPSWFGAHAAAAGTMAMFQWQQKKMAR